MYVVSMMHSVFKFCPCNIACGLVSTGCRWGIAAAVNSAPIDRRGLDPEAQSGLFTVMGFFVFITGSHFSGQNTAPLSELLLSRMTYRPNEFQCQIDKKHGC